MDMRQPIVCPNIPNSVPEVKARMLEEVGAQSSDEFYEGVPQSLRRGSHRVQPRLPTGAPH